MLSYSNKISKTNKPMLRKRVLNIIEDDDENTPSIIKNKVEIIIPENKSSCDVVTLLPNTENIIKLVENLTANYTQIITIDVIKETAVLYWGGNGVGDRWANKKFNYGVIYSKKTKIYSENENHQIPVNLVNELLNANTPNNTKKTGILGIYVFNKRNNTKKRNINNNIHKQIINNSCVICGTTTDIICDHKNDLYNNPRGLTLECQDINDFQPLCNHCNLQKRQICKKEHENNKLYSAKNISRYKMYLFEFPWEKKVFDIRDINCKKDTYWYDPVEFENKIFCYITYRYPIIKLNIQLHKLNLVN